MDNYRRIVLLSLILCAKLFGEKCPRNDNTIKFCSAVLKRIIEKESKRAESELYRLLKLNVPLISM